MKSMWRAVPVIDGVKVITTRGSVRQSRNVVLAAHKLRFDRIILALIPILATARHPNHAGHTEIQCTGPRTAD